MLSQKEPKIDDVEKLFLSEFPKGIKEYALKALTPRLVPNQENHDKITEYFKAPERLEMITFVPEYDYKKFFFIMPRIGGSILFVAEIAELADVILSLSTETSVVILIPDKNSHDYIERQLGLSSTKLTDMIKSGRLRIDIGDYTYEPWAQDLGEPLGLNQGYVTGWMPQEKISDYQYKGSPFRLLGSINESGNIRMPAVLQGGNLTKAENSKGEKIVFIGSDDVISTGEIYSVKNTGIISTSDILDIYLGTFKATRAEIMGVPNPGPFDILPKQPSYAFHIDQLVFFPKKGVAVLADLGNTMNDDDSLIEIRNNLLKYEKQLNSLGFRVIKIPTTFEHIEKYQAYTNSIPLQVGSKTYVLMPTFGDLQLEHRIRDILMDNGMETIFIKNNTYGSEGNTHCITGQLSKIIVGKSMDRA